MLSHIWKFTLTGLAIAAIALQSTLAPALAVPYRAAPPTLAAATQLP